jgi:hypothetical protein
MESNRIILKSYSFHAHSAEKDIEDFLSCLNNNFSVNNDFLTLGMEKNFYTMINNFEKFMQYANIDEDWQLLNQYESNYLIFNIINKTKISIKQMLINGLLNFEYTNLIFEFNKQKPFVKSTQIIYKLLINAMLYTCLEHEIHIEQSLSLYLMHVTIYNNSNVI